MRVGWGCLKYLKREWNRKEGRETKILKRRQGGKLGQGVGALKSRRECWNPLLNCGYSSTLKSARIALET